MLQLLLYDQLNPRYLDPRARQVLFVDTTETTLQSPYGPLQFNPHSQALITASSHSCIEDLRAQGLDAHRVQAASYRQGVLDVCRSHHVTQLLIMIPSEPSHYRSLQKNALTRRTHGIEVERLPNTQFLLGHAEFTNQYPTKPPIMETFYRRMRKKTGILMDDDKPNSQPLGGKRNYDADNRSFDKTHRPVRHDLFSYQGKEFLVPVTRAQALQCLEQFCREHLHQFGRLEDAMYQQDDIVYHSRLSTAINTGLLTPHEVIEAVEQVDTEINNKEGFIRQILGWREYMYHRFQRYQDSIYTQNTLNHTKKLPDRFRRPDRSPLQMNCVNHVLNQVKNTGYSHHITRLMIIGNFCLLMGYDPHDVNKRFWEMYMDAFERVVTPNVLGMSQFADGGNLATKPYISSANYIDKMSDFCKHCFYDPKQKFGPRACPMNSLYWRFVYQHRELFGRQPYIVSNLAKMDITHIHQQCQQFEESVERGE